MTNVIEPTGVNVDVLTRDAAQLGIDINSVTIYQLGRKCDDLSRESKIPYPNRSDFITYNVYKNGDVIGKNVSEQELKDLKAKYEKPLVETVFDDDAYSTAEDAYNTYQAVVRQVFVWGLYYLTGTASNPKAMKAYSIAYDKGHSAGFEEVASEFDDLLDLIK